MWVLPSRETLYNTGGSGGVAGSIAAVNGGSGGAGGSGSPAGMSGTDARAGADGRSGPGGRADTIAVSIDPIAEPYTGRQLLTNRSGNGIAGPDSRIVLKAVPPLW